MTRLTPPSTVTPDMIRGKVDWGATLSVELKKSSPLEGRGLGEGNKGHKDA